MQRLLWMLCALTLATMACGQQYQRRTVEGIELDPIEQEDSPDEPQDTPAVRVALLTTTPLLNENAFEQKLSTWMPQLLIGFPAGALAVETGVRTSISRLEFGPEDPEFFHLFFDVPFRLNVPLVVTRRVEVGVILGIIVRLLEYDTRTTTDGGWARSFSSNNLLGEAGASIRFKLGRIVNLRIEVSTAQMGAGFEFNL